MNTTNKNDGYIDDDNSYAQYNDCDSESPNIEILYQQCNSSVPSSLSNSGKLVQRRVSASRTSSIHLEEFMSSSTTRSTTTTITLVTDQHPSETCIDIPIEVNVETIARIVKEKNLSSLRQLGGIKKIAVALNTNLEKGICGEPSEVDPNEDLHRRRINYGSNTYMDEQTSLAEAFKSFMYFVFKAAVKDWSIFILFCCASIFLAFGIKKEGWKTGWYEGTSLFIIIFVIVSSTSTIKYWSSRRSRKLVDVMISVLRYGDPQNISTSEVVVGDIIILKPGDCIPADGLLIKGHGLEVHSTDVALLDPTIDCEKNPFLYCGGKVIAGDAHMLVTSVGINTAWGEMMNTISHDSTNKKQHTFLLARVEKLSTYIQNIVLLVALLGVVVLLVRYMLGKKDDDENAYPDQIGHKKAAKELMKVVVRFFANQRGGITGLTAIISVMLLGIQQELSLIITLSLFYWNKRTESSQVIIHKLCGCVNLGSVTALCIDKIERLTLSKMEVAMFWVGKEVMISSTGDIKLVISQNTSEVICNGVEASLLQLSNTSTTSPIKDSLLSWAKLNLKMDIEGLKPAWKILSANTISSEHKIVKSGLLMKKDGNADKTIHLHWKGSAETILAMCSDYYGTDGIENAMDEGKRAFFENVIRDMDAKGLESVAFAYRPIKEYDVSDESDDGIVDYASMLYEKDLILVGIFGIKYQCCSKAKEAVRTFLQAGVSITLVSEHRFSVVETIARECGILGAPDQDPNLMMLIEGEKFRKLAEGERSEKVKGITVMSNATPSDKLLFVQCLRQNGHVVAAMGERMIDDIPTLEEADVGILMAAEKINTSEMAKEFYDIVILNSSLASMITVLLFGRYAYQSIRKMMQVQLTITVSGLLISFVSTATLGDSPITTLQLIFVNVIVGSVATLALVTEQPTSEELLEMRTIKQTGPLITKAIWRNIIVQVSYQSFVLLIFQFKGQALAGMKPEVMKAMIFSGFVLCQVCNQFNARKPEKKNVFKGILGNYWFLLALGGPIILQFVVVEFPTALTCTSRLNLVEWLVCILFAITSCPLDCVGKCISTGIFTNRTSSTCRSLWCRFTSLLPSTTPLASQLSSQLPVTLPIESSLELQVVNKND